MVVTFYAGRQGKKPVADYLRALPSAERAQVAEVIWRIETYGLAAANTRQIDGRLWEIKVSAHRAFYVVVGGDEIVVLHAYRKQGQKAPPSEIEIARTRMNEVLSEATETRKPQ